MLTAMKRIKHRREIAVILNRVVRQVTLKESHTGCRRRVLCESIYNYMAHQLINVQIPLRNQTITSMFTTAKT